MDPICNHDECVCHNCAHSDGTGECSLEEMGDCEFQKLMDACPVWDCEVFKFLSKG